MTRAYHKGWQSDRPLKKDSRRCRWFQGQSGDYLSIRINFEDGHRRINQFYTDADAAQKDWEAFKTGELTTADLIAR